MANNSLPIPREGPVHWPVEKAGEGEEEGVGVIVSSFHDDLAGADDASNANALTDCTHTKTSRALCVCVCVCV